MTKESMEHLNTQTLVGFTEARGNAWTYRKELQGSESNHYPYAIPVADVRRRLFNWEAVSLPIAGNLPMPDGSMASIESAESQGIWRPDYIMPANSCLLGKFKDGYAIHQYGDWLVDELAVLIDDDIAIGSAGLLENGGMAWVQIDLPETITTKHGEKYRVSLLACTSHNGKLSSTFKLVITRVVCDNTLSNALSEGGESFKVKHSKYSDMKITNVRQALGIMFKGADDFEREMEMLMAREVSGTVFTKYLDVTIPIPEKGGRVKTMAEAKRSEYMDLYLNDPRVAPWAGTAWGVLQADNTWRSHFASVHKGTDRGQRNILAAATGKSFDADALCLSTLTALLNGAEVSKLNGKALVSV